MGHNEQRVWRYALDNKTLDEHDIAEALNMSVAAVRRYMGKIGTPPKVLEAEGYKTGTMARQEGGDHYREMSIQPWEALAVWLTPEEHRGYHKGVAVSYLAREGSKGGSGDIRKAIHHLERLLEVEDDAAVEPEPAEEAPEPRGAGPQERAECDCPTPGTCAVHGCEGLNY